MNLSDITPHTPRSETILQIGEGNFLRAFADYMIDLAVKSGVYDGGVVLCQPIPHGMADAINRQRGLYTVLMRGMERGVVVERSHVVTCVTRCIHPYNDYAALLEVAQSPHLRVVISNTTEAGIAYKSGDRLTDAPPSGYPAKLCALLYRRYTAFDGAADKGLLILPVELIDRNGDHLKRIVLQYAAQWGLDGGFVDWLHTANAFANTLVDRIVTGYPRGEIEAIQARLGYEDDLLVTCEPFGLWVIEVDEPWRDTLPLDKAGLPVVWTRDMTPYRTRKVRILNGAHTVSVLAAHMAGHATVLDMMGDAVFRTFIERTLWDEVIPHIRLDRADLDAFARAVLERFSNPFIQHRLTDIALNSVSKYKARCLPSLTDYAAARGRVPTLLSFGLAALLVYYRGDGHDVRDDGDVVDKFAVAWGKPDTVAHTILSDASLWDEDLTHIGGLLDAVDAHIHGILTRGARQAVADAIAISTEA